MADERAGTWPRPYYQAGDARTKILFVCFAEGPLAEVPLERTRFGLPSDELVAQVDLREHRRAATASWFENWWQGAFGVLAGHDLGDDLPQLTRSDVCYTVALDLPDCPDLAPIQSVWGLSRWLCARGGSVVLDVHAFRFRTRAQLESADFSGSDVQRDVKIVLENEPSQHDLHLFHTRGLCKFARPELLCFVRPEDAEALTRAMNQLARTLMEGALASQLRLRVAPGVELTTSQTADRSLVESLGLESAVVLGRGDGAPLAGVARIIPQTSA
jgi:hypothetical protein